MYKYIIDGDTECVRGGGRAEPEHECQGDEGEAEHEEEEGPKEGGGEEKEWGLVEAV